MSYRYPQEDGPRIGGGVVLALAAVVAGATVALYATSVGLFDRRPAGRMYLASMIAAPSLPGAEIGAGIDDISTSSVTSRSAAPPICNYELCAQAYRSFLPSDCTFQPFDGPRRLCRK